jgi:hypothetical protein
MEVLKAAAGTRVQENPGVELLIEEPQTKVHYNAATHQIETGVSLRGRRSVHLPQGTKTAHQAELLLVLIITASSQDTLASAAYGERASPVRSYLESLLEEISSRLGGAKFEQFPWAGTFEPAPYRRWVASSKKAAPAETPEITEPARGTKKPRVNPETQALAKKVREARKSNPAMSKSEAADWIETHCRYDEKPRLKRNWGPDNPITEDDVKNAWSRMQQVEGWLAWSEGKLPLRN